MTQIKRIMSERFVSISRIFIIIIHTRINVKVKYDLREPSHLETSRLENCAERGKCVLIIHFFGWWYWMECTSLLQRWKNTSKNILCWEQLYLKAELAANITSSFYYFVENCSRSLHQLEILKHFSENCQEEYKMQIFSFYPAPGHLIAGQQRG